MPYPASSDQPSISTTSFPNGGSLTQKVSVPQSEPPSSVQPSSVKQTFKNMPPWILRVGGVVLCLAIGVGALFYFLKRSDLIVTDQILGDTIQFQSITIGYPQGGFIVVQAQSGLPYEGLIVARTGHMDPGSYTDLGIPLILDDEKVAKMLQPGYYYAFLYADGDGFSGPTFHKDAKGKDFVLRDVLGRYLIKRFRLR